MWVLPQSDFSQSTIFSLSVLFKQWIGQNFMQITPTNTKWQHLKVFISKPFSKPVTVRGNSHCSANFWDCIFSVCQLLLIDDTMDTSICSLHFWTETDKRSCLVSHLSVLDSVPPSGPSCIIMCATTAGYSSLTGMSTHQSYLINAMLSSAHCNLTGQNVQLKHRVQMYMWTAYIHYRSEILECPNFFSVF